jgi:hypothetical protein
LLTACDNAKTKPALKSFDLITALLDAWNDIPVVARPQHVRDHQDDRIGPLTFLKSLNVRMDLLAKSIAQTHIHNGCPALNTFSTVGYGTITIRGIMVCTNLQRTLYQTIHHQDMIYFLANHLCIDEQRVHTDLAWHSFRKATKECSFPMQKFISKWLSGDTATGLVMKRRKQRLHAHCPRCGEDDEHLLHVLICSADAAVDIRQPLLTDLENWLIDEDTHPDIADYLLTGLTSWFEDPFRTEPVILSTIPPIRQHFFAVLSWNYWLPANKHATLPFNLDVVDNDGQYALFIGVGKSYTSFGCTGMLRCTNLKRITTIEV